MTVLGQPPLPVLFEVVTGTVVDDQEELAPSVPNELLEEFEEGGAVEHGSELIRELGPLFERDDAEHVRGLAHAEGVYAGLAANTGPRLVERPVEPEAGFV